MKTPLVFASANSHKVEEVSKKLHLPLRSLLEIGCAEELEETSDTLEGNAAQKARYIYNRYGANCFADDTGLEVEALRGRPGVFSARYAGKEKNPEANMNLLLEELKNEPNRAARFRTVIHLIFDEKEYSFEGVAAGTINREKRGELGFGYDPLFIPHGNSRTLAEMTVEEKNFISHRAKAIVKLHAFLVKNFI